VFPIDKENTMDQLKRLIDHFYSGQLDSQDREYLAECIKRNQARDYPTITTEEFKLLVEDFHRQYPNDL